MNRIAVLLLLCACRPPTTPSQPAAPLPPDEAAGSAAGSGSAAAPSAIAWPAYPTIGDVPVSHPSGDPIVLPMPVVKVGEHEHRVMTSSAEQHFVAGANTRYQLTRRDFDVDIKVLAVDAGHAARLEVDAHKAQEWIALGDAPTTTPSQDEALLHGPYTVSTGGSRELHDDTKVERGPGMAVYGREQEELASMFGEELRGSDPIADFMRAKKLRLGEVVQLSDAEKQALGGLRGTITLALVAADAKRASYQLDIAITADGANTRVRGTITFDRATGARIEQRTQSHRLETSESSTNDTFDTSTIRDER